MVDPMTSNGVKAALRHAPDANWLRTNYGASERRVCGLLGIAVSTHRYRSRRSDESLREKLVRLARGKPHYGYRRLHGA